MKKGILVLAMLLLFSHAMAQEDAFMAQYEKEHGAVHTWSLETQAEFSSMDYGSGFSVLPMENEITQDAALEKATAALKTQFKLTNEQLAAYTPYFSFYQTHLRTWQVMFYQKDLEKEGKLEGYQVSLRADTGELVRAYQVPQTDYVFAPTSQQEGIDGDSPYGRMRLYEKYKATREMTKRYGDDPILWPFEAYVELSEAFPEEYNCHMPKEGEITLEKAKEIATGIMLEHGVSKEAVEKGIFQCFLREINGKRQWEIQLHTKTKEGGYNTKTVMLDALTGELPQGEPAIGNG